MACVPAGAGVIKATDTLVPSPGELSVFILADRGQLIMFFRQLVGRSIVDPRLIVPFRRACSPGHALRSALFLAQLTTCCVASEHNARPSGICDLKSALAPRACRTFIAFCLLSAVECAKWGCHQESSG